MSVEIRAALPEDAPTISPLNADVQQMHADAYPWRFKSPGAQTFTEKDAEDLLTNLSYFAFLAFDGSAPIGYLVAEIVHRPETARQFAHELIYIHEISVPLAHAERGSADPFWTQPRHTVDRRGYRWLPWTLGRSTKVH